MDEIYNIVESARKLALLSVLRPSWDSFRRKICRWYSEKFHTPLKEVEEDLDFFDVLLHYFEYSFDQLEDKDRLEQLVLAIESPEERKRREVKEDLEEQEFLEQAIREEEEKNRKEIDFKNLAKQIKDDKLIKKTEEADIDISIEEKLDLDKPSF